MKQSKSFTLIELILSSLIVVFLGTAVYAVFSGGVEVLKRVEGFGFEQKNYRLTLEALGRELANAVDFSQIPFKGRKDSVSFASLQEDLSWEEDKPIFELTRVVYFLNEKGEFCRSQQSYPEALEQLEKENNQEKKELKTKKLISDIAEVNFSYLVFDSKEKQYEWQDNWPGLLSKENQKEEEYVKKEESRNEYLGPPQAVKIKLTRQKNNEAEPGEEFSKIVRIPLGKNIENEKE